MYTSLPVLPARTAPAGRQAQGRQAQGVKVAPQPIKAASSRRAAAIAYGYESKTPGAPWPDCAEKCKRGFDREQQSKCSHEPSLFVIVCSSSCKTRRCDRPHSHTESSPLRCFPPCGPAGTSASPGGDTCVSLCLSLSRLLVFSAVARRRRPIRLLPLHTRALYCHVIAQS